MTTKWYSVGPLALIALFAISPIALAEENVSGEGDVEVEAEASIGTGTSLPPATIRERLRADYDARINNVRANQGVRNGLLDERREMGVPFASTTRPAVRPAEGMMDDDARARMMFAASTSADRRNLIEEGRQVRQEDRQERREERRDMAANMFRVRHDRLIAQLRLAISNLTQIRDRISSRIDKAEENGRTMTDARALLSIADGKITAAKNAIETVAAYVPSVSADSSASASSTVSVDLERPRELGTEAISAIKDARSALVDVVTAIAHAMGLKLGASASTTVEAPGDAQ